MRLKVEAHDALRCALVKKWEAEASPCKFTREARADLLGLCIKTADKVWLGAPADRASYAIAFASLGLDWDESLCESDRARSLPEFPEPMTKSSTRPNRGKPFGSLAIAWGVSLCLLVLTLSALSSHVRPKQPQESAKVPELWTVGFYRILADGSARYHSGDYEGASHLIEKAVEIARANHSPGDLSSAIRMVADLNAERGDFAEAEAHYSEALFLRATFREDRSKPAILEALGDVQVRCGEFAAARTSLVEALTGYRSFRDPVGIAMTARDLGSLSYRLGHMDSAAAWFQASLKSIEGTAKPDIVADIRGRRALILGRNGQLREARSELESCLRYWQSRNHPRWVAVTESQLGLVAAAAGDFQVASSYFAKCRDGFRSVGDRAGTQEASRMLKCCGSRTDGVAVALNESAAVGL